MSDQIEKVDWNHMDQKTLTQYLYQLWETGSKDINHLSKESRLGLEFSKERGWEYQQAQALRNLAYSDVWLRNPVDSVESAKKAQEIFKRLGDEQQEGTCWEIQFYIYNFLGDLDKAMEFALGARELFRRSGYLRGLAWSEYNFGMLATQGGELESALSHYDEAIRQFREIDHEYGVSQVAKNASRIHRERKEYDKALEYLNLAQEVLKDYPIWEELMLKLGQTGIYRCMGKLKEAGELLEECAVLLATNQAFHVREEYFLEKGLLALAHQDYELAMEDLNQARTHAMENGIKPMIMEIDEALAGIWEAKGEYKKALKAYKTYLDSRNNLFDEEMQNRLVTLRSRREIELAEEQLRYQEEISKQTEAILLKILPAKAVKEIRETGRVKPLRFEQASVLFTDFSGFTKIASDLDPEELVSTLDACFSAFDKIMSCWGLEKIKTLGDGYMAVAGVPEHCPDHALRAITAALQMIRFMEDFANERSKQGLSTWGLRIGIHCGPLVAGIVGSDKYAYDIWGHTVNLANRFESSGEEGKINVSREFREKVKQFVDFEPRGGINVKGAGRQQMFFVTGFTKDFAGYCSHSPGPGILEILGTPEFWEGEGVCGEN